MSVPSEQDRSRCACARCPSFVKGDRALFCVHGRSKMNVQERGCICRTCPVHVEYQLSGRAYCLRGKPQDQ
jgi:hypothetical protein